ncbi:Glycogenin-1 [Bulinus truncatus]|nr:Glycogenin-1 [Bulinus truncatus]
MGESRESQEAFVTLATNDTYALGCLVLGHSLRKVGTTRQLVVMVSVGVSDSVRSQLGSVFDLIVPVNVLDSSDTCNLALLGRPDLSVTFTKFHCWRLTQFKKCVFMDADTLVVRNIDDLFDREELSASPDAGWPDCFNSGVFVFEPSEETYKNLLDFAVTSGSFDGGDQGLLNLYFKNWATEDIKKHLPFTYNVVSQAFYSYLPAFKQFYDDIKVVHFIGAVKPWHHSYNSASRVVTPLPNTGHSQEFLQLWWDIFMESVQPHLDPQLPEGGIVGELASLNLQSDAAGVQKKDDRERKLQWEQGQADYMGIDKFDNIKARLDEKMSQPTGSQTKLAPEPESKVSIEEGRTQPEVTGQGQGAVAGSGSLPQSVEVTSSDSRPPVDQVVVSEPSSSSCVIVPVETRVEGSSPPETELELASGSSGQPEASGIVAVSTSVELESEPSVAATELPSSDQTSVSVAEVLQLSPVSSPVLDASSSFSLSLEGSSDVTADVQASAPADADASLTLSATLPPPSTSESLSKPEPKSSPPEAKSIPESSPKPEPAPKPEPKSTPEPSPKPEPKLTPEPAPKPEPKSTPEPPPKPELKLTPEPAPKPEPKSTPEPPPKPELKLTPEPAPKPEPKSTPEPAPKTQPKSTPEPPPKPEPKLTPEPSPKSSEPVAVPSPESAPSVAPKHKPTPFSFKEQESQPSVPSPKVWSPAVKSPAQKEDSTSPGIKTPPTVAPKPFSPVGAGAKPSFISSQASKFDKPATTAPAPPKSGSLGLLASRFEAPKGQTPVGAASKTPAPVGAAAKTPAPTEAAAKSPTSPQSPSSAASKGTGTNREEMFARFGVRLPPPKK